ncbi:MAG: nitrogenase component 1 [Deltaproteobacteria bacterium]|jgi:nitrogenase molybdenum-iron protein alpha chain|nr:nitrogenase component 1 [Deltaproteobacteria bacterium]
MDYLKGLAAPDRCERLGAGVALSMGCGQIQGAILAGALGLNRRTYSQTYGCQFTLSLSIINTFQRTVLIAHGPVGCGACSVANAGSIKKFKNLRQATNEGLIWVSTNLGESEVINGGENKLRQTILEVDKLFRPEIIIIPVGCVPAIIGDDVESLVAALANQVSAKLVPVHSAGFKSKVMATAYDDVYHGVLKNLTGKLPLEASEQLLDPIEEGRRRLALSRTVNVLNVFSMSYDDERELRRLLEALDLKARFFPEFTDRGDFKTVLDGALNVSLCGTHDDYYLEHVKSLYGQPFITDTLPVGPRNTARWLKLVAGFFGETERAERLIAAEEAALNQVLGPFRQAFLGKKAFLSGGEVRVVATAELLNFLGLTVVGFKGHHLDRFILPAWEQLEVPPQTVFHVATQQPSEQISLINRLKPDLFVGHAGGNNITARQGLPILPLFSNAYGYMGYSGIFEVARRLRRILQNGAFNRNLAKHRPLPYRKAFYDCEADAYLEGPRPLSEGQLTAQNLGQ